MVSIHDFALRNCDKLNDTCNPGWCRFSDMQLTASPANEARSLGILNLSQLAPVTKWGGMVAAITCLALMPINVLKYKPDIKIIYV